MTSIDYAALAHEMRQKAMAKNEPAKTPSPAAVGPSQVMNMEGAAGGENPLKPDETIVMLHPLGVSVPLPPSLQPHRMGFSGAAYVPNILTVEEEQSLMREIYLAKNWTQLSARRLQNWGGIVRALGMREELLPSWLMSLQPKLAHLFPCPFNHVLINEYLSGQGILSHEDGPLYYPVVAIVSLNNSILIEFSKKRQHTESGTQERVMTFYLQPRSLFVFAEELYTHHLHAIEPRTSDTIDELCANIAAAGVSRGSEIPRNTRVSLTIRVVPKVIRKAS